MRAIGNVYTIDLVALILEEDIDTIEDMAFAMSPEEGRLIVRTGTDDNLVAFTEDAIELLRQLIQQYSAEQTA
jgi:hypothetical protein